MLMKGRPKRSSANRWHSSAGRRPSGTAMLPEGTYLVTDSSCSRSGWRVGRFFNGPRLPLVGGRAAALRAGRQPIVWCPSSHAGRICGIVDIHPTVLPATQLHSPGLSRAVARTACRGIRVHVVHGGLFRGPARAGHAALCVGHPAVARRARQGLERHDGGPRQQRQADHDRKRFHVLGSSARRPRCQYTGGEAAPCARAGPASRTSVAIGYHQVGQVERPSRGTRCTDGT